MAAMVMGQASVPTPATTPADLHRAIVDLAARQASRDRDHQTGQDDNHDRENHGRGHEPRRPRRDSSAESNVITTPNLPVHSTSLTRRPTARDREARGDPLNQGRIKDAPDQPHPPG